MNVRLPSLSLLVLAFASFAVADDAGDAVSFRRDVAPIFVQHCLSCHGPNEAKSQYRLDTFERLMKAGASEFAPITPKKPADSELLRLLTSNDSTERMPQKADPLPAEQIALIRKWIEQGALFGGGDRAAALIDILPRRRHPGPPAAYTATIPITALAFNHDGSRLAASGYHEVTLWNPATGKLATRIKNVAQRTHALAYSPNGKTFAVAGGSPGEFGEVRLFNAADGKLRNVLGATSDVIFDVTFSADGELIAACGADGAIRIWQARSGAPLRVIKHHNDWVMAVAFSPDGKRIASASRDKSARVFDVVSGKQLESFGEHGDIVYGVAFAPDGDTVFSAGADNRVRQWKVSDGKKVGEMKLGGDVFDLHRDGDALFVASADKTARRFNAGDRKETGKYEGHGDWVYSVAHHAGTKRVATGGHDGRVRVFDAESGETIADFTALPGFAKQTSK